MSDVYRKERMDDCEIETDAYLDFVKVFKKHFPKKTHIHDGKEYDNSDPRLLADKSLARAVYWYINERYRDLDYTVFPQFMEWFFGSFVAISMEDIIPKLYFIRNWMKEKGHREKNGYDWNDIDNWCFYVPMMEDPKEDKEYVTVTRDAIICDAQSYRFAVVFEYWSNKIHSIHLRELAERGKRQAIWRGPRSLRYLKKKYLNDGYGDCRDGGYLVTVEVDCDDIPEWPSTLNRVDRPEVNLNMLKASVFDIECLYNILKEEKGEH